MARVPESIGRDQGINLLPLPPGPLIARRVEVPVMQGAQRHREGIRDFAAQGAGLGKLQVVRLGRLAPADQAGVRGHKPQVILVAEALDFRNGEEALVNGPPLRNSTRLRLRSATGGTLAVIDGVGASPEWSPVPFASRAGWSDWLRCWKPQVPKQAHSSVRSDRSAPRRATAQRNCRRSRGPAWWRRSPPPWRQTRGPGRETRHCFPLPRSPRARCARRLPSP